MRASGERRCPPAPPLRGLPHRCWHTAGPPRRPTPGSAPEATPACDKVIWNFKLDRAKHGMHALRSGRVKEASEARVCTVSGSGMRTKHRPWALRIRFSRSCPHIVQAQPEELQRVCGLCVMSPCAEDGHLWASTNCAMLRTRVEYAPPGLILSRTATSRMTCQRRGILTM